MGDARQDFPIAIIGAGFAGIGAAIQLEKAGIRSYTIFERAGEIGGTWRDNTYPGAACDVPSHVYSFSFEPNPGWSRAFAESGEIQDYLLGVVEKWNLRPHLRLDTEIVDARFDEEAGTWTLTTGDDETFKARVVVAGVGGLVDEAESVDVGEARTPVGWCPDGVDFDFLVAVGIAVPLQPRGHGDVACGVRVTHGLGQGDGPHGEHDRQHDEHADRQRLAQLEPKLPCEYGEEAADHWSASSTSRMNTRSR